MAELTRVTSRAEYEHYIANTEGLRQYKRHLIGHFTKGFRSKKTLPGYSVTANRIVDFTLDKNIRLADGTYHLRETVNCPQTRFSMRMRATIHAVQMHEDDTAGPVYLCEQKTPLFTYFERYFPDIVGSEYLGDSVALGGTDSEGLRNEDATQLTFDDDSFNVAMSFEVLEHIPDYTAAFKEAHRTLRPGGRFYFTAPFNVYVDNHHILAKIENGEIVHIHPPEYHGDPVTGEGILCFQHFGWDILQEMQDAGFKSIEVLVFDQVEYGYYAQDPILVFRAVA